MHESNHHILYQCISQSIINTIKSFIKTFISERVHSPVRTTTRRNRSLDSRITTYIITYCYQRTKFTNNSIPLIFIIVFPTKCPFRRLILHDDPIVFNTFQFQIIIPITHDHSNLTTPSRLNSYSLSLKLLSIYRN